MYTCAFLTSIFYVEKRGRPPGKRREGEERARFFSSRGCIFSSFRTYRLTNSKRNNELMQAHQDLRGATYRKVIRHRKGTGEQQPSRRAQTIRRRRRRGSICSAGSRAHDGPLSPHRNQRHLKRKKRAARSASGSTLDGTLPVQETYPYGTVDCVQIACAMSYPKLPHPAFCSPWVYNDVAH